MQIQFFLTPFSFLVLIHRILYILYVSPTTQQFDVLINYLTWHYFLTKMNLVIKHLLGNCCRNFGQHLGGAGNCEGGKVKRITYTTLFVENWTSRKGWIRYRLNEGSWRWKYKQWKIEEAFFMAQPLVLLRLNTFHWNHLCARDVRLHVYDDMLTKM